MNAAAICRIAVVGPESSGKSSAVREIAKWLGDAGHVVASVPEAGRVYAESLPLDHVWTMADEVEVARLHLRLMADAVSGLAGGAGFVVSDGAVITPRVWALRAFGEESPELVSLDDTNTFDLLFLTKPDLPWHPDPIRTSPENRPIEYVLYTQLLNSANKGFTILEGSGRDRIAPALATLATFITNQAVPLNSSQGVKIG